MPEGHRLNEWLTYEEAANRLGIKADSVRRQARAKKWARRKMNDGVVQVEVPGGRLEDRREDNPPAQSAPDLTPDQAARLAAAEVRADLAEKHAEEIREDRDKWRDMAQRLSEPRSIFDRVFRR